MKKLILFIHGLGGSRDTWGKFEDIIKEDRSFDKNYHVEFYEYDTALFHTKGLLSLLGKIGKVFSIFEPTLSKIQDISRLLESKIESQYRDYNDIYLVAHSMGGLVSLKYIVDKMDKHSQTKIKKLLLYDVPNQGSHLAKVSSFYNHSQLIQLDKYSDFLDDLNHRKAYKDIEKILKLKCLICQDNIVVDKNSAQAHYRNVLELDRTHTEIVKPIDKEDEVYLHFKNFIIEKSDDEFLRDIFDNLSNEIFVLLHQKYTHTSLITKKIHSQAKTRFKKHFYHFVTPHTEISKTKYYQRLGELIGVEIKNITEFADAMGELAKKEKVLLYINNFEDNSDDRALELSTALRNLKENYYNFHAIIIGQEKLANMTYRSDATLSPLNNAIKKIFPNNAKLEKSNLIALVKSLESYDIAVMKDFVESEFIGDFDIGDTLKMKLFWCNILDKRDDGGLYWKDMDTCNIFRELIDA